MTRATAVKRIDGDTHLFELPNLWHDYADPADRDRALRIVEDDRGWSWLQWGDRQIHLAEVHTPGDVSSMGANRRRQRAGERAPARYVDALPTSHFDPVARLGWLDDEGLDEAVCFPHYGLFWIRTLADDPIATMANLNAWNRWAIEVQSAGRGRLHAVGQVVAHDLDWVVAQIQQLANAGVRLAMMPPMPVEGRCLSHPIFDRMWSAFVDHDITPIFHIADFARPFADPWYEHDVNPIEPLLMSLFISTPPQLALADLTLNGVFARHPRLRLGLVEFTSSWLAPFLRQLDVCLQFHHAYEGLDLPDGRPPSSFVREHVRVAAFGFERPQEAADPISFFGSDWPHAEGSARPIADFIARGGASPDDAPEWLFHGNVDWLLHQDQ